MLKREPCDALLRRFAEGQNGHVAVTFAVVALPLLIAVSGALDFAESNRTETQIKAALDHAAMAAVSNQSVDEHARKALAEKFFWDNISDHAENIKLEVVRSDSSRVELSAKANIPTTVLALTGKEAFQISSESAASVTRGGVVCMMTLDPMSERSFEVTGGAMLSANTCSVQVNSSSSLAAVVDHGGQAMAKDFCITGAARGPFRPHVNTECSAIQDPYKTKIAPDTGECIDRAELVKTLSTWQAESSGVTLQPGTYCGGLNLYRKVVKFEPGVYTMKDGPLIFDYGTLAKAHDVTFVMQGLDATLDVHEGSRIYLSAPKKGPTAGLAIFQDTHTDTKNFPTLPSGNTTIRSGGNVNIVGTVYLPHQKISFRGGSLSQAQAPATSFIGYRIHIGDGARIGVAVDHSTAGLPPILPRHDEGVRLER